MWTCSGFRPAAVAALARSTVWNCVPVQMSQRSSRQSDQAVQRLHRRVGQERHVVLGAHPPGGAGHRGVRVALEPGGAPRRLAQARILGLQAGGVHGGPGALVPGHLQRVATLLRGPERVGDHRDAGRHLDHARHAPHAASPGGVQPAYLGAEHGRARDEGGEHAGDAGVQAELRGAGDLLPAVEAQRWLADQPELRRILEGHVRWHRHRPRLVDELAVGRRPSAGAEHAAVLRAQARAIDLPGVGGGGQQHLARGGAGPAQPLPLAGHAHAAAGELHAELWMVVGGVNRRGHHAHALEIDLELLGDQHGQRGGDALAHLGLVDQDGHHVVPADADEGVWRELGGGAGRRLCRHHRRQAEAEQDAARDRGRLEEVAARGAEGAGHVSPPWSCARPPA